MEEQQSGTQSDDSPLVQMEMNQDWRPAIVNPARGDEAVPRRLEWIAVILFIVNFFMMMYTVSSYYSDEAWGLIMVAVSTATAVVLLLSVVFSIFGKTELSKLAIGVGIVGLMISVVSLGARLMQEISEYNDRWYF